MFDAFSFHIALISPHSRRNTFDLDIIDCLSSNDLMAREAACNISKAVSTHVPPHSVPANASKTHIFPPSNASMYLKSHLGLLLENSVHTTAMQAFATVPVLDFPDVDEMLTVFGGDMSQFGRVIPNACTRFSVHYCEALRAW